MGLTRALVPLSFLSYCARFLRLALSSSRHNWQCLRSSCLFHSPDYRSQHYRVPRHINNVSYARYLESQRMRWVQTFETDLGPEITEDFKVSHAGPNNEEPE